MKAGAHGAGRADTRQPVSRPAMWWCEVTPGTPDPDPGPPARRPGNRGRSPSSPGPALGRRDQLGCSDQEDLGEERADGVEGPRPALVPRLSS